MASLFLLRVHNLRGLGRLAESLISFHPFFCCRSLSLLNLLPALCTLSLFLLDLIFWLSPSSISLVQFVSYIASPYFLPMCFTWPFFKYHWLALTLLSQFCNHKDRKQTVSLYYPAQAEIFFLDFVWCMPAFSSPLPPFLWTLPTLSFRGILPLNFLHYFQWVMVYVGVLCPTYCNTHSISVSCLNALTTLVNTEISSYSHYSGNKSNISDQLVHFFLFACFCVWLLFLKKKNHGQKNPKQNQTTNKQNQNFLPRSSFFHPTESAKSASLVIHVRQHSPLTKLHKVALYFKLWFLSRNWFLKAWIM